MNFIPLVIHAAFKVGVSPLILLSICNTETNLRNINNKQSTAFGICQLQLRTAKQYGGKFIDKIALQQPKVNLEIAAKYFKNLKNKYGSTTKAIAAYNLGHITYINDVLINQKYVDKCYNSLNHYKRKMCEFTPHKVR